MFKSIAALVSNFRRSEDGAVTVDWVVLTAAIVGLGVAVLNSVGTAVADRGDDIERCLARVTWNIDPTNGRHRDYVETLQNIDTRCKLDNL